MKVFDLQSQKFVEANGWQDFNALIGAEYGTTIEVERVGNTIFALWVDDEGINRGRLMNMAMTSIVGYPVFGDGIVVAYDIESGEDACLSTHEEFVIEMFADDPNY